MNIQLSPSEQSIILDILGKYLSASTHVWVFGSRARGTAKKFSDLDLALDDQGKIMDSSIMAELSYDLEESDLPFKVDIIDLNSISNDFRQNITKDLKRLICSRQNP